MNFTFVNGDDFTPNPTPLGPNGPTLKQFLNRRPRALASEVNVLDAVSKSNQQLLSEIIRVSRLHAVETGSIPAVRVRGGHETSKEVGFATRNPFQLLSGADQADQPPIDQSPTTEAAGGTSTDQTPKSDEATPDQPVAPKAEKKEVQKKKTEPIDDLEESPFKQIVTGCGTVTQSDEKYGLIRVDENFSTNSCKIVEFYPYACLSSILEGKLLSDEVTMSMIDPAELMSRYPAGTEVGYVAAFIEGFNSDQETASALQICAKSNLLDGFGHCDYDSIFSDHAFLVSKSGQLHWSPCCDSSLLLFRSAFGDETKERRLSKMLISQDWLEYKSMPTPAVALFDACPIVVKAAYLRLTGLIVRLTKDYGVIRSARVNDVIIFRNSASPSVGATDETEDAKKRRPFKVGDWVQFRIRKQDSGPAGSSKADAKGNASWKALNLQLAEKPRCVFGDVKTADCVEKIDNFRQRKKASKSSSSSSAVQITAFGYTGEGKKTR